MSLGRLVWIDIETTGLDPDLDELMEVGVVVTTEDLRIVGEYSEVLRVGDGATKLMHPSVHAMHTKNGLISECRSAHRTLSQAEQGIVAWLERFVESDTSPMCGSSVHFDRSFLKVNMPYVVEFCTYRNIDVSTVKELCARWWPHSEAWKVKPEANKKHRAVPDLYDSIAELKFFKEHFFTQQ